MIWSTEKNYIRCCLSIMQIYLPTSNGTFFRTIRLNLLHFLVLLRLPRLTPPPPPRPAHPVPLRKISKIYNGAVPNHSKMHANQTKPNQTKRH
jgi:hypothetical protein